MYTQGYEGVTAAALFPVQGIIHLPTFDVAGGLVYLPLPLAQSFLAASDRLTAIPIMVDKSSSVPGVERRLRSLTGDSLEVMDWQEMLPELVQAIQADYGAGVVLLGILYLVVGFGVFGTVMMMTSERIREFGILVAIGMKKPRLMLVSMIEAVMVSGLGALVGVLLGIPVLAYMHLHPILMHGNVAQGMRNYGIEPILPFSNAPGLFVSPMLVVFVIGLLCATYPLLVIRRLKPSQAMRR